MFIILNICWMVNSFFFHLAPLLLLFSKKNKEILIHFISFIMVKQDVEQTFQSTKQS